MILIKGNLIGDLACYFNLEGASVDLGCLWEKKWNYSLMLKETHCTLKGLTTKMSHKKLHSSVSKTEIYLISLQSFWEFPRVNWTKDRKEALIETVKYQNLRARAKESGGYHIWARCQWLEYWATYLLTTVDQEWWRIMEIQFSGPPNSDI